MSANHSESSVFHKGSPIMSRSVCYSRNSIYSDKHLDETGTSSADILHSEKEILNTLKENIEERIKIGKGKNLRELPEFYHPIHHRNWSLFRCSTKSNSEEKTLSAGFLRDIIDDIFGIRLTKSMVNNLCETMGEKFSSKSAQELEEQPGKTIPIRSYPKPSLTRGIRRTIPARSDDTEEITLPLELSKILLGFVCEELEKHGMEWRTRLLDLMRHASADSDGEKERILKLLLESKYMILKQNQKTYIEEAIRVFSKFDTNVSGYLSCSEFQTLFRTVCSNAVDDQPVSLQEIFTVLTFDPDGQMPKGDFYRIWVLLRTTFQPYFIFDRLMIQQCFSFESKRLMNYMVIIVTCALLLFSPPSALCLLTLFYIIKVVPIFKAYFSGLHKSLILTHFFFDCCMFFVLIISVVSVKQQMLWELPHAQPSRFFSFVSSSIVVVYHFSQSLAWNREKFVNYILDLKRMENQLRGMKVVVMNIASSKMKWVSADRIYKSLTDPNERKSFKHTGMTYVISLILSFSCTLLPLITFSRLDLIKDVDIWWLILSLSVYAALICFITLLDSYEKLDFMNRFSSLTNSDAAVKRFVNKSVQSNIFLSKSENLIVMMPLHYNENFYAWMQLRSIFSKDSAFRYQNFFSMVSLGVLIIALSILGLIYEVIIKKKRLTFENELHTSIICIGTAFVGLTFTILLLSASINKNYSKQLVDFQQMLQNKELSSSISSEKETRVNRKQSAFIMKSNTFSAATDDLDKDEDINRLIFMLKIIESKPPLTFLGIVVTFDLLKAVFGILATITISILRDSIGL